MEVKTFVFMSTFNCIWFILWWISGWVDGWVGGWMAGWVDHVENDHLSFSCVNLLS